MNPKLPDSFRKIVGEMPPAGRLPDGNASPFETIRPAREGHVERDGVRCWYAVWGDTGPWLAFASPLQMVHSQVLKATVPYLSEHFRVITTDNRGNGRSDRPVDPDAYSLDHYVADFTAVLDAAGADRVALVGISAAAMTVLRVTAEQPERVSHVVIAGGFSETLVADRVRMEQVLAENERIRADWPAYIEAFMSSVFSEPHSTKPFEDGVRYGWSTSAETMALCRRGWGGNDVRDMARQVRCATLVIHGDEDRRVPHAKGEAIHEIVPGSRMLTVRAGGHVTAVRDPVLFNRCVRDFVAGTPRRATWTRAMSRPRKALFVSSPIGLGHVQRDLAIARELRKLEPRQLNAAPSYSRRRPRWRCCCGNGGRSPSRWSGRSPIPAWLACWARSHGSAGASCW